MSASKGFIFFSFCLSHLEEFDPTWEVSKAKQMALLKRSIPKVHKCGPLDQIAGKAGWLLLSNLPRGSVACREMSLIASGESRGEASR